MTGPLYLRAPVGTLPDLVRVDAIDRVMVRRRGFHRRWLITARDGQLLTLAPADGGDQSITVHADEVEVIHD